MIVEGFHAGKAGFSRLAALPLAAGVAALGGAYGSQYLGGLRPCELCLWQRWPWWVAATLGLLAILARRRPAVQAALLLLAVLAVFTGAGIAVFHVGVEQHWWPGLASCGGAAVDAGLSVEALRNQIMGAPVVRCDEVAWSLLGISMAGYNALLSAAVGALVLVGLWYRREGMA